ncbi:MAG: hypothetical protein CM15mP107_4860 [Bacteroidota bacterium]|nr:MAG: hypothetical protein CM15mP107_4860 [Bacteroidota bacterium]
MVMNPGAKGVVVLLHTGTFPLPAIVNGQEIGEKLKTTLLLNFVLDLLKKGLCSCFC